MKRSDMTTEQWQQSVEDRLEAIEKQLGKPSASDVRSSVAETLRDLADELDEEIRPAKRRDPNEDE